MGVRTATIDVAGIRCERCVMRLGAALQDLEGLEAASANLVGEVTVAWDDHRLTRDAIVHALRRAGFPARE